jgi:imidazolonepropionase-like amidohydrolase
MAWPRWTRCARPRRAGAFLNEPIGTIAPGMLADLLLVDGNP